MYQRDYMAVHDIDAFFVMNDYPTHIASNGGMLSKRIGTIAELQYMTQKAYNLPMVYEYNLNMDYLDSLNSGDYPTENEMIETGFLESDHFLQFDNYVDLKFHQKLHIYSFVEMARRGFWSFDRIIEENLLKGENRMQSAFEYILIAWPKDNIKREQIHIGHSFFYRDYHKFGKDRKWDLMSLINRAEIKK